MAYRDSFRYAKIAPKTYQNGNIALVYESDIENAHLAYGGSITIGAYPRYIIDVDEYHSIRSPR